MPDTARRRALRITSLNANGLRSALAKGAGDWLGAHARPDWLCLQETRIGAADLTDAMRGLGGLRGVFHHAERPGYSGVGLYFRVEPEDLRIGFGSAEFDAEGRYVEARYRLADGLRLAVVSVYFPSGSSGQARQQAKFRFLDEFEQHMLQLQSQGEVILCGDVNIAHQPIDLKNWKGNLKNSGFLPEERAWMSHVLDDLGWVDVFRSLNPLPDQYTWWSNRGQARARNVGWRIDYHLATPRVAALARRGSESIYVAERFSDHAPLSIDYELAL